MDVIIIGNGFDLAHGLPTQYTDFLDFVDISSNYIENMYPKPFLDSPDNDKINRNIYLFMRRLFGAKSPHGDRHHEVYNKLRELSDFCKKSFWMKHFKNARDLGDRWVDFEHEISLIIQRIENSYDLENQVLKINILIDPVIGNEIYEYCLELGYPTTFPQFQFLYDGEDVRTHAQFFNIAEKKVRYLSDCLLADLNQLIELLQWYLHELADKQFVTTVSQDILDIFKKHNEDSFLSGLMDENNPDKSNSPICVISFNYTNTFERLYDSKKLFEYDFIHGKIYSSKGEKSNVVLGIDEYLSDQEKDKKLTFIKFKKYYQRIYKKTGCNYKSWDFLNEVSRVYIFGHSLDYTDRDILEEIIKSDKIITTVFYHNNFQYEQQIANLVKILGQEKVISLVYGKNPHLIFEIQKPMRTRNNKVKEAMMTN